MKDKKGQMDISTIMYTFIAVIVGLILFQVIAQSIGTTTNTITLVNDSYTASVDGGSFYITDYRALSNVVIYNETNGTVGHSIIIPSTNYTINNNVVYEGALAVNISVDDALYESMAWKVSGTAQPLTYIANGGARSLVGIITIFFALAIAVVALYPIYGSKLLESFG